MKTGRVGRLTLGLAVVAAGVIALQTQVPQPRPVEADLPLQKNPPLSAAPDFTQLTVVTEKKQAFFDFLRPLVEQENDKTLEQRLWVKTMVALLSQGQTLEQTELNQLSDIAQQYRFELRSVTEQTVRDLMERVDIVPVEMVLIQAANESGWGVSRFAVEGNNYFGQWCFSRGCGLVPNARSSGLSHEVARFDDARGSVSAYLRNLNTNAAYAELRTIRRWLREADQPVTAEDLIPTLLRYSERKEEYVAELLQMLDNNRVYL
ncbi:glucosaminidase domain-containing protein [Ferrimonas pelagia]